MIKLKLNQYHTVKSKEHVRWIWESHRPDLTDFEFNTLESIKRQMYFKKFKISFPQYIFVEGLYKKLRRLQPEWSLRTSVSDVNGGSFE